MSFERYDDLVTGVEFRSRIGDRINPRSYCDDDSLGPVDIYINKAPVCKLKLTPTTQFANTNIAWDISQSVSSTGTINTFDIAWGGTTDIGDLTAQAWTGAKSGNVQFTTAGRYLVVASVTDLLGEESKYCQTIVNIVEFVNLQRLYIGTTDGGLYILEPGADPIQYTGGLTGNHQNFRSSRLNPFTKDLDPTQQHIWACTQDGLAYSLDGAGTNFNLITEATLGTPANDAGDSPAPSATDPDNIDVAFDPQNPDTIIVLRTTATRSWCYISTDYGATWANYQVGV